MAEFIANGESGASVRAKLNGLAAGALWTAGLTSAWDLKTGALYGSAAVFTDTHATSLLMATASRRPIEKRANVVCRENGIGLQVVPAQAQLGSDPITLSTSYPVVSGTGTAVADASDPFGAADQAWTLTDADVTAVFHRQRNLTVPADTLERTASVLIQKTYTTPTHFPAVQVGYVSGLASRIYVDTQTGATVCDNTNARWTTEDYGDYWFISGAIANNGTSTTFFHVLSPARSATLSTTASVSTIGATVFAWPNISLGGMAVPPSITTGGGGENLAFVDQSAWSGQAVAGFVTLTNQDPGSAGVRLFACDGGTAADYIAVEYALGRAVLKVVQGGVSRAALDLGPWWQGRQTIAFAVGPGFAWGRFVRGHAVTAAAPSQVPTTSKFALGGLSVSTTERRARVTIERVGLLYGAADTETADIVYDSAVLAHGAVPTFWDNFDRADGAPGTAPSGQEYVVVAASGSKVLAAISDKRLIGPDSPGGEPSSAAYSAVDLGDPLRRGAALVCYQPGPGTAGAGLIATHTLNAPGSSSILHIVLDGSCHIVFSNVGVDIGFYQDNAVDNIAEPLYPQPMLLDGETAYWIEWEVVDDTATFYFPNGAPFSATDSRFSTLEGRYFTVENFRTSGNCEPEVLYVEAN